MNVVVVDEWLPFPVNNGKKLRSYHLLAPLARDHRITYVCPRSTNRLQDMESAAALNDAGIEVVMCDRHVPPNSGPLFAPRLVANLVSSMPYSVQRHASREMRATVAAIAKRQRVDLIHVEWTPYFYNLPHHVSAPVVINAHNIESLIWKRYYDEEKHLARAWYIRQQWQKFQRFETSAFAEAGCVVTTTELDANLARTQFGAGRVEVVDNGVDTQRFQYVRSGRDPYNLLFLGSLNWRPNQEGVRWLLTSLLPGIRKAEPRAALTIVGCDPPAWLVKLAAETQGAQLYESVPDVRPYFEKCGALLVPLRVGGGSRIKILEAMAAGCPVISTAIGAEGLHIDSARHFLQADDDQAFIAAAVSTIQQPSRFESMTSAASDVVRARYDWNMLSQRLEQVWLSHVRERELVPA